VAVIKVPAQVALVADESVAQHAQEATSHLAHILQEVRIATSCKGGAPCPVTVKTLPYQGYFGQHKNSKHTVLMDYLFCGLGK
jgi:hypothetical protein